MNYNEITSRIDELNLDGYKHIKNNDWGFPNKLMNWLEEKGFDLIGEGAYSSVWRSEKEKFVVKVNRSNIDEGYLEFLEFCKNSKNKHLPKTGTVKKYENWYIVFIEKLKPSNISRYENHWLTMFFDEGLNKDRVEIEEAYDEYLLPLEGKYLNDDVKEQFIELSQLVSEFEDWSPNGFSMNDIHSQNIMMRGDTYVITDPISE